MFAIQASVLLLWFFTYLTSIQYIIWISAETDFSFLEN